MGQNIQQNLPLCSASLSQPSVFLKIYIKIYKDYCLLETNQSTLDHQWPGNSPLSQFKTIRVYIKSLKSNFIQTAFNK